MTRQPKTKDIDLRLFLTRALLDAGIPRGDIRHEAPLDTYSCDGRADMVVLADNWLVGVELKSGSDKLDRCATQARQYTARFDQVFLVADIALRPEPKRLVVAGGEWFVPAPNVTGFDQIRVVQRDSLGNLAFVSNPHWGWQCEAAPWTAGWRWQREQRRGKNPIVAGAMLSLLRAAEAFSVAAALVQAGRIPPARAAGTRSGLIPHLQEHASVAMIRPLVVQQLRARQLNRWEEAFWRTFDAQCQEAA